MGSFSIRAAFGSAWWTFKKRPFTFMGLMALNSTISLLFGIVEGFLTGSTIVIGMPFTLLRTLVSSMFTLMFLNLGFNVHRYDQKDCRDIFQMPKAFSLFISGIVSGFVILIGMILLIIPGIFISVRWTLATYVIVDQEAGPIEGLSESWELTKGNWWKLFFLSIITFFVSISGILLLGVGVFFTSSLSTLIWMHVYLQLNEGDLDDDAKEEIERLLDERERRYIASEIIEEDVEAVEVLEVEEVEAIIEEESDFEEVEVAIRDESELFDLEL